MKKILLINGPNLNMLGSREPEQYGSVTISQIVERCQARAQSLGFEIVAHQSNVEGEIVSKIQTAADSSMVGIIINPAAYTHTSVAIRDAIAAVAKPTIEIHLSNIFAREDFRHHSFVSGVVKGVITGLGAKGYELAIEALVDSLK